MGQLNRIYLGTSELPPAYLQKGRTAFIGALGLSLIAAAIVFLSIHPDVLPMGVSITFAAVGGLLLLPFILRVRMHMNSASQQQRSSSVAITAATRSRSTVTPVASQPSAFSTSHTLPSEKPLKHPSAAVDATQTATVLSRPSEASPPVTSVPLVKPPLKPPSDDASDIYKEVYAAYLKHGRSPEALSTMQILIGSALFHTLCHRAGHDGYKNEMALVQFIVNEYGSRALLQSPDSNTHLFNAIVGFNEVPYLMEVMIWEKNLKELEAAGSAVVPSFPEPQTQPYVPKKRPKVVHRYDSHVPEGASELFRKTHSAYEEYRNKDRYGQAYWSPYPFMYEAMKSTLKGRDETAVIDFLVSIFGSEAFRSRFDKGALTAIWEERNIDELRKVRARIEQLLKAEADVQTPISNPTIASPAVAPRPVISPETQRATAALSISSAASSTSSALSVAPAAPAMPSAVHAPSSDSSKASSSTTARSVISPKKPRATAASRKQSNNTIKLSTEELARVKAWMSEEVNLIMRAIDNSSHPVGKVYLLTRTKATSQTYQSLKEQFQNQVREVLESMNDVNYLETAEKFSSIIRKPRDLIYSLVNASSQEQIEAIQQMEKKWTDFFLQKN